jgi:hypothetical protein
MISWRFSSTIAFSRLVRAPECSTMIAKHCSPRSCARRLAAAMIRPAAGDVIEIAAPMLIEHSRAPPPETAAPARSFL